MHSFHHSRGRILFETACALTISASCVAAWMDLGVPAFLPAAAVAALYGLVHLFDMRRPKAAVAVVAPAVWTEAEPQGDLLAYAPERAQPPEPSPSFAAPAEEPAPVVEAAVAEEPEPAPAARPKKRKPSKKKAEPIAEAGPVAEPAPAAEVEAIEEALSADTGPIDPEPYEEPEEHAPVTPLFEPEPFVRQQQRAVFGRKAS